MAYIRFAVISVSTDLQTQSVYITFNKQLDTDTVTLTNLMIASQHKNNKASLGLVTDLATFDIDTTDDLKTIILRFHDTPEINTDYALLLREGIADLEGTSLEHTLFRYVRFESTITSKVNLISPANFEKVTDLTLTWEETGSELTNCYRVQVSTENVFHVILIDSVVSDKTSVSLSGQLGPGQYYYRIRPETTEEYGTWSEVRTFIIEDTDPIKTIQQPDETAVVETDIEPVIEDWTTDRPDRITLETGPDNGVTPLSFMFRFSEDIVSNTITVSVIRSDF